MAIDPETATELEFAQAMVTKYRELLLASAGMKSIGIDGQMVTYAELESQYAFWTKKLARLQNTRPSVVAIDLRNAF